MSGHEAAGGWSRPRAAHLSLPELPCLAQEHILIHCSSSDLASLRCCSIDNRRMVDRTVTKLFPWLLVISPSPQAAQPKGNGRTCGDLTARKRSNWPAGDERQSINPLRTEGPSEDPSAFPFQTAQAEVPLPPPPLVNDKPGIGSNITEAGLGAQEPQTHITTIYTSRGACADSRPHNSISELVLRHHPHLDRCLDPSSASYSGESGQQLPLSGGLSPSSTQLQTIHLPCRLRTAASEFAGAAAAAPTTTMSAMDFASCLAAIPSLTSLSACLMCLADIPAAREAARYDLSQHELSLLQGDTRESPLAAAGMSRSASWLAQQHKIRMEHLQESELARRTELHVNQQLLAAVRQLPSLAQRLVQLTLTEMPHVGEAFEAVAACTALTRLVLSGWVPKFFGGPFTIAANGPGAMVSEHLAALVNGLPRLRHLDLYALAFLPALDFGILSALTGLTYLRLNQAMLYDATYGTHFERLPSDFLPEPLLEPFRGIERIAGLPQLHSLALTGLDCPPRELLEALPPGGGPLRLLALRKIYRLTSDHLNALGALTNLTELQLSADWCLHPGRNAPPPLDLLDFAGDLENGPMMMVDIGGEDIGLLFAQAAPVIAGPEGGGGGGDGGGAGGMLAGAAADDDVAGQQQPPEAAAPGAAQDLAVVTAASGSTVPNSAVPTAAGATAVSGCQGRPADDGGEALAQQLDEDSTHGTAGPSSSVPPAAAPQLAGAAITATATAGIGAASGDAAHGQGEGGPGQHAQAPIEDGGPDFPEGHEGTGHGQGQAQEQELVPQPMEIEIDWEMWGGEAAVQAPNYVQHHQQEAVPGDAHEAPANAGVPAAPPFPAPQPAQAQAQINAANAGGWVFLPGAAFLFGELAGGGAAGGGGGGGGDRNVQQRDERLEPLRRLRNLQVLHLGVGRIFGVVNMGPRFLDHLSAMTSLTSLSLRCNTVDWGLLSVLAPLPRLAHLSMHYYDGRGNDGKKIAANLLTWHNLTAVTTLQLGAFEARHDADIITRVLPRTRLAAASVFGMRSCQPGYDVFSAVAQTTSLTRLSVQGDWMVPRGQRDSAASVTAQTLSSLRRLPLLRSLSLDLGGADNALIEGGVHAPAFQDVIWMMAGMGQQGAGAQGAGGGGGALMGLPPLPLPPLPPLPLPPPLMLPLPPFPLELQPPPPPVVVQLPPVALPPLAHAHQQLEQPPQPLQLPPQQGDDLQHQEQQPHEGGEDVSFVTRAGQAVGSWGPTAAPEEQVEGAAVESQVAAPPPPSPASVIVPAAAGAVPVAAPTAAPAAAPTAAPAAAVAPAATPATASPFPWRPTFKEVPVRFEEESDSEEEEGMAPARLFRAAAVPSALSRGSRNSNSGGTAAVPKMERSASAADIADGPDMSPGGTGSAAHTWNALPGATAGVTTATSASLIPAWASGSSDDSDYSWDILDSGLGVTGKGTGSRPRSRSKVGAVAQSASRRSRPSYVSGGVPSLGPAGGAPRPNAKVDGKGRKRRAGREVGEAAVAAEEEAVPPERKVEARELTPAGRWLMQVSELPQLTSLKLERWPAVPPLALAPLTGLQRLQLIGLQSLDEKLLEALSRLPTLTYLTLEGQARAHIGSSVFRTLTRTPYIRARSVWALGTLTRLRLLVLSGFTLVPPPKQHPPELQPRLSQLLANARHARSIANTASEDMAADLAVFASAAAAASTAAGAAARRLAGAHAGGTRAAATAAEPDGTGPRESRRNPRYRPYRATPYDEVNHDRSKAKRERLFESLGRLRGLRYLSLCIVEKIEASDLIRLCGLLPGLRMLNLPADAASRPKLPQLRPLTLSTAAPSTSATSAAAAPNGEARRGGSRVGGGGVRRGVDDDNHDSGQGKRESVRKVEWKLLGSDAGPSGQGAAADTAAVFAGVGGNDGGAGPSQPPPPRPLPPGVPSPMKLKPRERSFAEQLEGLTAAVYSGLSEGEFWRVIDGLDVEIRAEGALLGVGAGASRHGDQNAHPQL
ncbi:hypothetical protein Vretimale_10237 [Volvox reticuliferus]|uniref:F-box domain-containing protein n=1 Tax=Volvox reticuliferus TaxID=1737510 RepID=A0A8J4FCT6_9CHLO|nr:hypothetical protein Vretifemale_713 [Volvox reticuliferus]GIM05774.1 hypothetical protein Vretimale_10237 [Volvox reticuliferus]